MPEYCPHCAHCDEYVGCGHCATQEAQQAEDEAAALREQRRAADEAQDEAAGFRALRAEQRATPDPVQPPEPLSAAIDRLWQVGA